MDENRQVTVVRNAHPGIETLRQDGGYQIKSDSEARDMGVHPKYHRNSRARGTYVLARISHETEEGQSIEDIGAKRNR